MTVYKAPSVMANHLLFTRCTAMQACEDRMVLNMRHELQEWLESNNIRLSNIIRVENHIGEIAYYVFCIQPSYLLVSLTGHQLNYEFLISGDWRSVRGLTCLEYIDDLQVEQCFKDNLIAQYEQLCNPN